MSRVEIETGTKLWGGLWAGCPFKDFDGVLKVFHPVDTFTLELQVNDQKPTPIIEKHPVDGFLVLDKTLKAEYADSIVKFFTAKRTKRGDYKIKIILEG